MQHILAPTKGLEVKAEYYVRQYALKGMSRGKFYCIYICISLRYCTIQLLIFRFSFLHNS